MPGWRAAGASRMRRGDHRRDPGTGQYQHQLLHVLLRVPGTDAQRMQFHQFARVVFVGLALDVLRVVEELQHGRALQRGQQQVAESAQRARPDHVLLVGRRQQPHATFCGIHAEMVQPEPDHLFLERVAAIDGVQQLGLLCLLAQLAQVLLRVLFRCHPGVAIRHRLQFAAGLRRVRKQFGRRRADGGVAGDQRRDGRRQGVVAIGELPVKPALAPQLLVAVQRGGIEPEAGTSQPAGIGLAQRGGGGCRLGRWRQRRHRRQ